MEWSTSRPCECGLESCWPQFIKSLSLRTSHLQIVVNFWAVQKQGPGQTTGIKSKSLQWLFSWPLTTCPASTSVSPFSLGLLSVHYCSSKDPFRLFSTSSPHEILRSQIYTISLCIFSICAFFYTPLPPPRTSLQFLGLTLSWNICHRQTFSTIPSPPAFI